MSCFNFDLGIGKCLSDLLCGCFKFFEEPIRFSTFPKKNKKKLENDKENLKRIRDVVTTIIQKQEQTRPGTECEVVVNSWLDAVNDIDTEVNTLLHKLAESKSCTCCCFPRHNYRLGKGVVDLIERVNSLVEERKTFDDDNLVSVIHPNRIHNIPDLPTTMIGRDGESSKIHGYLRDSQVKIIGILGIGGIGKTTLMLKSIKQWLSGNKHDFHYIIWIEMSQNEDDILKIQKRIASCISPSLKLENDEQENARKLANALRSKKSLVLIDNVGKELDFVKIGIPFAEDTVVKIFFTTRLETVCHDMRAHKIVRLGLLNDADSLELFKRNISPDVDLTDMILRQRVDEILKSCGGLPLLIVRVARTVANYTRDEEWVHAVESLRKYGSQITGEEIEGGCFKLMDKFPKKNKENLEKEMHKLKGIRDVVSTTFQEQERTRYNPPREFGQASSSGANSWKEDEKELFTSQPTKSEEVGHTRSENFDIDNLDNIEIIKIGYENALVVDLRFYNGKKKLIKSTHGKKLRDSHEIINLENGAYICKVEGAYQHVDNEPSNPNKTQIRYLTFFIKTENGASKNEIFVGVSENRLKSPRSDPLLQNLKYFSATPTAGWKIDGFFGSIKDYHLSSIGFYAKKR